MLDKDGVDIAANSRVPVSKDTGDALELLPYAIFDVYGMTLCQL